MRFCRGIVRGQWQLLFYHSNEQKMRWRCRSLLLEGYDICITYKLIRAYIYIYIYERWRLRFLCKNFHFIVRPTNKHHAFIVVGSYRCLVHSFFCFFLGWLVAIVTAFASTFIFFAVCLHPLAFPGTTTTFLAISHCIVIFYSFSPFYSRILVRT